MKYATVCSGIEAPSLAWHGLGWSPVWFSEIENFPAAILKHHYPTVPNLGDMTLLHENETYKNESIDLLCGGTPCQSFSTAGLRAGLDDERGNLALQFIRILGEKRPTWFVWENVYGVFSSASGRDFATILGGFTGRKIAVPKNGWENSGICEGIPDAYGIAWTTLDAQYFGVPQRRRRVFVVGHLGDWHGPAAVLFDTACLSGNPTPGREAREGVAGRIAAFLAAGGKSAGSVNQQDLENGNIVYRWQNQADEIVRDSVTAPLKASGTTTDERSVPLVIAHGQSNAEVVRDGSPSLTCNHETPIVFGWQNSEHQGDSCGVISPALDKSKTPAVFDLQQITSPQNRSTIDADKPNPTLSTNSSLHLIQPLIRRFTPTECERLQGMPDNYTRIPLKTYKEKRITRLRPADMWEGTTLMSADGPRYRAIGNSMAVPVMRWIGERIDFVHKLLDQ